MTVILFALGAMVCASVCFLVGAIWATLPRHREGRSTPALTRVPPPRDTDRLKLAS